MLTILGRSSRRNEFCDGASRRDFLKIGGLTMGGLTLPQLLRAESQSGIGARRTSSSRHVGSQAGCAVRDSR